MRIAFTPSYDELKNLFYCDRIGNLYWKIDISHKMRAGAIAGSLDVNGYRKVKIHGNTIKVHRVLYCLYNKRDIPDGLVIDHIDGDKLNNRKNNLRAVTLRDNNWNRKGSGDLQCLRKVDRYTVSFDINKKAYTFGTYRLKKALRVRNRILHRLNAGLYVVDSRGTKVTPKARLQTL